MTNITKRQKEVINLVAAGLLAAAAAHMGLSLLSMPRLLAASASDLVSIILTAIKISWCAVGFIGSAYVIYNAVSMLNAKCFNKARIAAIGALILPLLGVNGIITAFALLPIGALAVVLLRKAEWQAAFARQPQVVAMPEFQS